MNAYSIIMDMEMQRDEKQIFLQLAKIFDRDMPQSLYLDYYELAYGNADKGVRVSEMYDGNQGTTPDQWEQFLDTPEIYRYRNGKIAKLTEYAATKALKNLSAGADTSALKELIKTSKQIQGGQNAQTIIMSYVTPKQREPQI